MTPEQLPTATDDALGHEKLAGIVLDRRHRLDAGSAAALRGPWGRGKTDLLGRLQRRVDKGKGGRFVQAVAINPWRYGQPDLLTPLVRQ